MASGVIDSPALCYRAVLAGGGDRRPIVRKETEWRNPRIRSHAVPLPAGRKDRRGGNGGRLKALDTTLEREVAIKVLPDSFAADAERLARFEREAQLLAFLNHPGIATIHGLHDAEGVRCLAMELAPGIDLAQRLAAGTAAGGRSARYRLAGGYGARSSA